MYVNHKPKMASIQIILQCLRKKDMISADHNNAGFLLNRSLINRAKPWWH